MDGFTGTPITRRAAIRRGMGAAAVLPLAVTAAPQTARAIEGKVALVTGSGRRLGRATVLELARQGADVIVNGRSNREEAESVVREAEALGARAVALMADVGIEDQVNRMAADALEEFGRIDILINNAGARPPTTFQEMSTSEWREVMAVNLDGPFFCSKAVVPSMIANGGGRIINVSGLNSWSGTHWPHVCASKMGALGLTRALATELGPHNILVNLVVPGAWDFEAANAEDAAPGPTGGREIPLGRRGLPQELANVYAFLASDASSYVTGQTLHVNGGQLTY